MIADVELPKVIAQFGHMRGTSAREVGMALRAFGYQAQFKLTPFKQEAALPRLCLLKQTWSHREQGHWVVYDNGTIYCPGHGLYAFGDALALTGGRFTSYLKLTFF